MKTAGEAKPTGHRPTEAQTMYTAKAFIPKEWKLLEHKIYPVSYTHLDVYKRQRIYDRERKRTGHGKRAKHRDDRSNRRPDKYL